MKKQTNLDSDFIEREKKVDKWAWIIIGICIGISLMLLIVEFRDDSYVRTHIIVPRIAGAYIPFNAGDNMGVAVFNLSDVNQDYLFSQVKTIYDKLGAGQ